MKIAITGATGFVGTRLVERLQQDDHQLVVFTRSASRGRKTFPQAAFPQVEIVECNILEAGPWQGAIVGCDAVVNLAGAPISERWTPQHKKAIIDSRQLGTKRLVEAINQAQPGPSVLVSSSAIGYYGTSETAVFDESSEPADPQDFLSRVCQVWEQEAQRARASGTRVVILRTGIVLGMGGAIAKMLPPFKLFAGGPIGSGKQWFSWIHRDDLVNLMIQAITDPDMRGIYNATAPNPVRMEALCQTLGDVLNRPSWLPVPEFVLETLLGDGAQVVLEGQKVVPSRTQQTSFKYQYPQLREALEEII